MRSVPEWFVVVVLGIGVLFFFGIQIDGDVSTLVGTGVAEGCLVVDGGTGVSWVIYSAVIAATATLIPLFVVLVVGGVLKIDFTIFAICCSYHVNY